MEKCGLSRIPLLNKKEVLENQEIQALLIRGEEMFFFTCECRGNNAHRAILLPVQSSKLQLFREKL